MDQVNLGRNFDSLLICVENEFRNLALPWWIWNALCVVSIGGFWLIRYLKREFSGSALEADVQISITAFHASAPWLVSLEANGMNLVIDYWSQILYIFAVDSRLHWWKFHGSDEIGFSPTFLTLKIFLLCVIIKGYLMFGVRIISLLKAVVSWFIIVTCIKKCQGR